MDDSPLHDMEANQSLMFQATLDGDLHGLKTCFELLTKVEARAMTSSTQLGVTPLIIACINGQLALVEFLIDECDADIELVGGVDSADMPFMQIAAPLLWAAASGHLSVVRCLLSRGADVNSVATSGQTALKVACLKGDLQVVKYLVAFGADVEIADNYGRTCLMRACSRGHYQIASYLIRAGAHVNRRDMNGWTALDYCMVVPGMAVVRLLLRHGADVGDVSTRLTPILMANPTVDKHCVDYLINLPFCTQPAVAEDLKLLGAKSTDLEVDYLVSRISLRPNASVEIKSEMGNACNRYKTKIILITKSITDAAQPVSGWCYLDCGGLMIKIGGCNDRLSMWMLGQDEELKTAATAGSLGRLTLSRLALLVPMFTDMKSKREAVEFEVIMAVLVVAVYEVEAQMKLGDDNRIVQIGAMVLALIGCTVQMHPQMSEEQNKLLSQVVRKFVSFNPRMSDGQTTLHLVCCLLATGDPELCPYSVVDMVRLLLDAGADPQAIDRRHDTPLHQFAKERPIRHDVIQLLLDRGAHFDVRNQRGECFIDLMSPEDGGRFNWVEYTTLKCLAARAVVKSNIQYELLLPRALAEFVKMH